MLHRARVGVVAFGMLRRVELVRDQHGRDGAPIEFDRRRQADRPAAADEREGFSVHDASLGAGSRAGAIAASARRRQAAGEKLAAVRPTGPPPPMSAKVSASMMLLWARDRVQARSQRQRVAARRRARNSPPWRSPS